MPNITNHIAIKSASPHICMGRITDDLLNSDTTHFLVPKYTPYIAIVLTIMPQ